MHGFYIKKLEYDAIRKNLVSKNNELIKIALQSLITKFEYGQRISMACSKDLCAVLHDIVRSDDYKIRKWAYHLIIYKHDERLIRRCIDNLTSGFEDDKENISWIFAIASLLIEENKLQDLYKKHGSTQISQYSYTICSTLFSSNTYILNFRDINRIVNGEEFLEKMWLTKVFACDYIPSKKKAYSQMVGHNVMNSLLQDDSVQRYALWAFSTLEKVNIKQIDICPHNAMNLPPKSLAWYYTGLFKDEEYMRINIDHINDILEGFLKYPRVVQMGILRGISNSTHSLKEIVYPLVSAYLELDEEDSEQLPLMVLFTRILIDHEKESVDITDILDDYTKSTKHNELRTLLWCRQANIMEGSTMGTTITINGNVGGIQNNDGTATPVQNNTLLFVEQNSTFNPQIIETTLKQLNERVATGEFDELFNTENEDFTLLSEKIQYEFNTAKNDGTTRETNVIELLLKIDSDLQEMTKAYKKEDRKSVFSSALTKISQLCTITVNAPKLWPVLKDVLEFIKTFLRIS